jgi:hypothetical protein
MFTLLKLGVGIVALLAFAWFGMTFKLGSRTLFEHLHAIGQTKESQELVDGTREAVRHRVAGDRDDRAAAGQASGKQASGKDDRPPPVARDAGAPLERLSSSEQRQLRYLLDKATH